MACALYKDVTSTKTSHIRYVPGTLKQLMHETAQDTETTHARNGPGHRDDSCMKRLRTQKPLLHETAQDTETTHARNGPGHRNDSCTKLPRTQKRPMQVMFN